MRAAAVALVAALALAGCSPGDQLESATDPPAAGTPRPTLAPVNPSAIAEEAAFGRWRPAAIQTTPALAAAAEEACRADSPMDDMPLRVLDVRGLGLFTLVFADDAAAILCRVAIDESGSPVDVVTRPVEGAAGAEPPAERTLGVHDIELVDESTNPRWVAVGQVGDGVNTVEVNFDDATWSKASMANGWYATWWSGTAEALGVAAVDTRNIVITSYAP